MHVEFTNTDSTGTVSTTELSLLFQGVRHEIDTEGESVVAVPDEIGEHLVESDEYAVTSASEPANTNTPEPEPERAVDEDPDLAANTEAAQEVSREDDQLDVTDEA